MPQEKLEKDTAIKENTLEFPKPGFKPCNPSKPCEYCQIDSQHMRVYPFVGLQALFSCDCGEISGLLPITILPLWLRLTKSKVKD